MADTLSTFGDGDRAELAARGIAEAEAGRQLELLGRGPRYQRLVRPATVGDGIRRLGVADADVLRGEHELAAREGRLLEFVPASGAASRMFQELLWYQRGPGRDHDWTRVGDEARRGDPRAAVLVRFVESVERFAFAGELEEELARRGEALGRLVARGDWRPILDALLDERGLDLDARPKGLIPFHTIGERARMPLDEHLDEAAAYVRDGEGRCRLHFTVSPEHLVAFEARLARVEQAFAARHGVRYEVGFSVQSPATDTLAADACGRPLRDSGGKLVFRPGGHGALIANLNELGGDLVYVKNIDNVQPVRRRAPATASRLRLGGLAARLSRMIHDHLGRLRESTSGDGAVTAALEFARTQLGLDAATLERAGTPGERRDRLVELLDRPLRVCGVVENTGEPGGGPFWVRDPDGAVRLQIVERAQVDPDDREQQAILAGSTHFNPVDLVCAVRGADGKPYPLGRFIDHDAVIVTRKSQGGHDLLALERPGLWNGAMAGWTTVFVEVPLETFTPVKTVLDLLRAEHQP